MRAKDGNRKRCRTDDEDVVEGVDAVDLGEELVHDGVRHARVVARRPVDTLVGLCVKSFCLNSQLKDRGGKKSTMGKVNIHT